MNRNQPPEKGKRKEDRHGQNHQSDRSDLRNLLCSAHCQCMYLHGFPAAFHYHLCHFSWRRRLLGHFPVCSLDSPKYSRRQAGRLGAVRPADEFVKETGELSGPVSQPERRSAAAGSCHEKSVRLTEHVKSGMEGMR